MIQLFQLISLQHWRSGERGGGDVALQSARFAIYIQGFGEVASKVGVSRSGGEASFLGTLRKIIT